MAQAVSEQDMDIAPVWSGQAVSLVNEKKTVADVIAEFAGAEDAPPPLGLSAQRPPEPRPNPEDPVLARQTRALVRVCRAKTGEPGARPRTPSGATSDDAPGVLVERFLVEDSLGAQTGQVEGWREAEDQFGEVAADGGGVLKTVPGEAVGQIKALQSRPFADDGVLVEGVDLVQAHPAAGQIEGLEGRELGSQLGPDQFVELAPAEMKSYPTGSSRCDQPTRNRPAASGMT